MNELEIEHHIVSIELTKIVIMIYYKPKFHGRWQYFLLIFLIESLQWLELRIISCMSL